MAVNYCHAEYPEKAPTLAPSPLVNRLNSLFDFFKSLLQFAGIRASRLSHVRRLLPRQFAPGQPQNICLSGLW